MLSADVSPTYDFEDVYEKLVDYVYWLAHRNARPAVWLMDYEEIAGELLEELFKGFQYYVERGIESFDELITVLKTMLFHRIGELKFKYTLTHRKDGIYQESLSKESRDVDSLESTYQDRLEDSITYVIGSTTGQYSTENIQESMARVAYLRECLYEPVDQQVYELLLDFDNEALRQQIELSGLRCAYVYEGGGSVKIRPFHIAQVLGIPVPEVEQSMRHIKNIYNMILDQQV